MWCSQATTAYFMSCHIHDLFIVTYSPQLSGIADLGCVNIYFGLGGGGGSILCINEAQ